MGEVDLNNKSLKQLRSRRALYDKKLEKITLILNEPCKKPKMGIRRALIPKHRTPKGQAREFSAEISRIDKAIKRLEVAEEAKAKKRQEAADEAKATKEAIENFNKTFWMHRN